MQEDTHSLHFLTFVSDYLRINEPGKATLFQGLKQVVTGCYSFLVR